MTLTQILQKIRNAFYTKSEIDSMGGGTSLSDAISQKANDSDVVHKSGDETIDGNKTFLKTLVVKDDSDKGGKDLLSLILVDESIKESNEDENGNPSTGHTNSLKIRGSSSNIIPCMLTGQLFTSGDTSAELRTYKYKDISSADCSARLTVRYHYALNSGIIYLNNISQMVSGNGNNTTTLGSINSKWKGVYTNAVNGANPGALSFPGTGSITIDTSDASKWLLDGTQIAYTPPVDGWLTINVKCSSNNHYIKIGQNGFYNSCGYNPTGYMRLIFPVRAGVNVEILVVGVLWSYVRLFPCQGNV